MGETVQGSEVLVRLRFRAGEVCSTELLLRRPLEVLGVALGRTPPEFLRQVMLLFPLCGAAHAVAALRAIEAAAGVVPDPAHETARRAIALADALAAHAWRCEFDWARLAGVEARPDTVAAARRATESLQRALYPDGDALQPGGGRLAAPASLASDWGPVFSRIAFALRLEEQLAAMRRPMAAALVGADPAWLLRLQTRFRVAAAHAQADADALSTSLRALCRLEAAAAGTPLRSAGAGDGVVDTARGELRWHVVLRGGRVVEGRPEAPIDRVFGPLGEARAWLSELHHASFPAEAARWIVAALDPCAPVRIEALEATVDA